MTGSSLRVFIWRLICRVEHFSTEAENSLLSKGLSFCPTPAGIDTYTLKTEVLEYVRRIRLKEYFYKDDDVDGNFSDVLAFRKKLPLVSRKE